MSRPTDAELLDALRDGDRSAGAELFERYATTSRVIARQLGAGAHTPDIVHDVWTQIISTPPDLRGDSLHGWLSTTIRNRVSRYAHKSSRVDPLSSRHAPHSPGTTPTQRVAHAEQLRRIWSALERGELTDEELQLVAMRYVMTSNEAGAELGIPASTYRGRVRRALKKLASVVGLS